MSTIARVLWPSCSFKRIDMRIVQSRPNPGIETLVVRGRRLRDPSRCVSDISAMSGPCYHMSLPEERFGTLHAAFIVQRDRTGCLCSTLSPFKVKAALDGNVPFFPECAILMWGVFVLTWFYLDTTSHITDAIRNSEQRITERLRDSEQRFFERLLDSEQRITAKLRDSQQQSTEQLRKSEERVLARIKEAEAMGQASEPRLMARIVDSETRVIAKLRDPEC